MHPPPVSGAITALDIAISNFIAPPMSHLAVLSLLLALQGAFAQQSCPLGWKFRAEDSACYFFDSDRTLDWESARKFCRDTDGGDLVSIGSQAEYDFVKDQVITTRPLLLTWIGLRGNASSWTNGRSVNFTKFASPSEASKDSDFCFGWRTLKPADGWRGVSCRYAQPFVCKQHSIGCPPTIKNGDSGTIQSSNFPLDYDNDLFCTYKIIAPQGYRILLNFTSFETQYLRDYVEVIDGLHTNSLLLGKMHGMFPEKMFYASSDNGLTVTFTTNPTITKSGWSANWQTEKIKDPVVVSGSAGTLESPNYPQEYPNDVDQVYRITVDDAMVVQLNFTYFDTENEFDYLIIADGPNLSGKFITMLYGSMTGQTPFMITTTQPGASLRFVTDESNSRPAKGWSLVWRAIPKQ
uniref:CUB domain-containing protein n=1 Tax=Steinernema glaseri TaxID=37863 RepID=A0A1I8AD29_9BILA